MLVNKSIETESGTIQFQGELLKEELDFILEIGLNIVLAQGASPFLASKNPKIDNISTEVSDSKH